MAFGIAGCNESGELGNEILDAVEGLAVDLTLMRSVNQSLTGVSQTPMAVQERERIAPKMSVEIRLPESLQDSRAYSTACRDHLIRTVLPQACQQPPIRTPKKCTIEDEDMNWKVIDPLHVQHDPAHEWFAKQ